LREWKRNETNVAEEYCWAMTGGLTVCCGLSGFGAFDFGFQLYSLAYT
jgi:hypothetical protein